MSFGHGLFSLGDVLLILSSRPRSLIGHAEGREVERIGGFEFASLLGMLNCELVLAFLGVNASQRQMGENKSSVLLNDPC